MLSRVAKKAAGQRRVIANRGNCAISVSSPLPGHAFVGMIPSLEHDPGNMTESENGGSCSILKQGALSLASFVFEAPQTKKHCLSGWSAKLYVPDVDATRDTRTAPRTGVRW